MSQIKSFRRRNAATGCRNVVEPDKQADQQVSHTALNYRHCRPRTACTRPSTQYVHVSRPDIIEIVPNLWCKALPEGQASSENDLSNKDRLDVELGQSRVFSKQSEYIGWSEDDADSGTDEQLSAAEVKITETLMRKGSTMGRMVSISASAMSLQPACHVHVVSCVLY